MDNQTESLRWRQISKEKQWMSEDVRIHGVMPPQRFVSNYHEIGIIIKIKLKCEGYIL